MKRWMIVLCLPIVGIAQLQIKGEPELLQGEIIAKRDVNGRYCAALQVVSSLDGFSYESYNGVVDVDDKPGKDLVYVSPDERVLEIYHSGFEPFKIILSEVGIVLKPRQVWRINITGEQTAEKLPVLIITEPKDAGIWIDGEKQPKKENYIVGIGEHELTVRKQGFETSKQKIIVNADNMVFRVTLDKVQDALVEISSEPSGAVVWLDGIKLGETPISRFYPPGRYTLKIEKEKYLELEETIEIRTPLTQENYTLEKNAAWLTINTNPSANVYLDGKRIYSLKKIELEPSVINIQVEKAKAEPLTRQVTLSQGQHLEIDMYPEIPTGTIRVAVAPFDANIMLVGDAGERLVSKGSHVFNDIPAGSYNILIKATGYHIKQENIILNEGETITRSFKLKTGSGFGSVTDINGNVYKTIKIGNQTWLAENFKATHYRNGDPIPNVTNSIEWTDLRTGAYCNYDNDESFVDTCGRLYNWYAVNDPRGLAPDGWRVPSDNDWKELELYLGMSKEQANDTKWRGVDEGGKLKEIETTNWKKPNKGALDQVNFTALPAGYRYHNGRYNDIGSSAYFWSTLEDDNNYGWFRHLRNKRELIYRYSCYKQYGFSVRLIRD